VIAILAIAGLGVALTACGDDDDDDAAPAADDGGDENAEENEDGDNAEAEDEGDGDNGGGGDVSEECLDLLGDYLEQLEEFVEDVDFESGDVNATLGQIQDEMGDDFSELDAEINDKCEDYDFTTDSDDMEAALEVARDRAPGTVAWLQMIQSLSEGLSDISIPDVSIPDVTIPEIDEGDGGDEGDDLEGLEELGVPQDCDGAIQYVRDKMEEFDSFGDMNMEEITQVSAAQLVITSECSVNQMNEFYSDPEVSTWMSG
jgi:hypothetical protein